MIQVRALQAQGSLVPGQSNPGLRAQILTAFATDRFAIRDEYFEFFVFLMRGFHKLLANLRWMLHRSSLLYYSHLVISAKYLSNAKVLPAHGTEPNHILQPVL